MQLKHKRSSGKRAKRHCGIAALHAPKCVTADEETLGHVSGGDASLPSCEREITAQLAKRMGSGKR